MPPLKFTEVLAYSSEDPNHPVENLLQPDTYLKWKSKPNHNEKQEYAILKLEKLSTLRSIDIGNEHSAFIEVLVGREGTDYKVLLVASSFMTPLESRNSSTSNRVRMFGPDKLNKNIADQKWDRVKITCTQPFNKNVQFGLTFIKVYGPENKESSSSSETNLGRFTIKDEEEETESYSIGSFFAKKQENETTLTGAASIRAASKASVTPEPKSPLAQPSPKRKLDPEDLGSPSANPTETGFYQLKKKVKEESPKPKELSRPPPAKVDTPTQKENNSKNNPKYNTPQNNSKNTTTSPKHNSSKNSSQNNNNSHSKPPPGESRPYSQLMRDVVFVLSGYQNPQRGCLRDSLVAMGAKYKADWGPTCTHLICAFKNTPKYQQVKGKGKIVSEKWVEEAVRRKRRMPWRRYSLERNRDESESEEEIWSTEICPKKDTEKKTETQRETDTQVETGIKGKSGEGPGASSSPSPPPSAASQLDEEDTDDEIERALQQNADEDKKRRERKPESENREEGREADREKERAADREKGEEKDGDASDEDDDYGGDTDVDEEENETQLIKKKRVDTSALPLPPLSDLFGGKNFLLFGQAVNQGGQNRALLRYITSLKGRVCSYMSDDVHFVVTEQDWDHNFDEALNENGGLQFVKPSWIWKCVSKDKIVPPQPFLVVPKDE